MDDVTRLRARVAKFSDAANDKFLELGRALRDLKDTEGAAGFEAFLKHASIGRRKAGYLMSIDKAAERFSLPKARLRAIGWTKLSTIAGYLTDANCEELLQASETYTDAEVKGIEKGNQRTGERSEGKGGIDTCKNRWCA